MQTCVNSFAATDGAPCATSTEIIVVENVVLKANKSRYRMTLRVGLPLCPNAQERLSRKLYAVATTTAQTLETAICQPHTAYRI